MRGARAKQPRRRELALVAFLLVVFVAAPTPGDIGGCGQQATSLNEATFVAARKEVDCQRCTDCGLTTKRCTDACNPQSAPDEAFPTTCHPLYHDGEVCLDALLAASCSDYATYVADVDPATPTECEFCLLGFDGGGT